MSSAVLRRKRYELWWLDEKRRRRRRTRGTRVAITRRRNRVEENGLTTSSTCLMVHGQPLPRYWLPQREITTASLVYGSFSQYRRNDPPGQPMAEVLSVRRLSTHIVLSIREYTSTHHTRKARKPQKKIQQGSYSSMKEPAKLYTIFCQLWHKGQQHAAP